MAFLSTVSEQWGKYHTPFERAEKAGYYKNKHYSR